MYLIGPESTRIWTDSNRNFSLRQYGRLEYGTPDVRWMLAGIKGTKSAAPRRPTRRLRQRLRYFLNSFRGFAAFDLYRERDSQG
jgi:hypothetical protein